MTTIATMFADKMFNSADLHRSHSDLLTCYEPEHPLEQVEDHRNHVLCQGEYTMYDVPAEG